MNEIKYYENLVFGGGGVLGFAYCGAINSLEKYGILCKFKRFAGSSIGSLFATLLSVGFTADDIMKVKDSLNLNKISSKYWIFNIFNLVNYFGLHSLDPLECQFRKILKLKVDPDITLKSLFEKTGKDLVIVTSCLNRDKPVYFHHVLYPDVKLIDALMCSVAVPFIFYPKKMNVFGTNDYFIDGGIVDNYPIWVFNDLEKLCEGNIEDMKKEDISSLTLGLKLLHKDELNTQQIYIGRRNIGSNFAFGKEIFNTLMMQVERAHISESYVRQTIPIKIPNVNYLDFNLSRKDIEVIVKRGEMEVLQYYI